MPITTPEAFRPIFAHMCQDIDIILSRGLTITQIALLETGKDDAAIIRPFIDDLLANHDPEELQEWWLKSPASIYFKEPAGLIAFLRALQEALQQPPYV